MPDLSDFPEEAALLGQYRSPEERAADEAAKEEAAKRLELRNAFVSTTLMGNPMFREWMREKLTSFGTWENTFGLTPTGFPDPLGTWFKAGMKSAGWALWEELDAASPDLASKMRRGE